MEKIKEINDDVNPRDYQEKIFESCKKNNCLVILPTGTGKTLIAIMLAIERFKKFPLQKILVLAPTRPLIEQHLVSFKKIIKDSDTWADMQIFTGKTPAEKRREIWQTAEFIFSTPQCISNDLKKNLYTLDEVSLLIVDECHRCLKNYAYNFVAEKYKQQSNNPKILGLTASPGSDKKTITQVCENLGIDLVEIRTRESSDVKPYLQELEFEKIEVDFPSEFQDIKFLLSELYDEKVRQLKEKNVLFGYPSKTTLLKTQSRIMNNIKKTKNPFLYSAASICAQAIKISHALELLETQSLSSFISYLKELYKQASEKKSKGVQNLVKELKFAKAYSLSLELNFEHPKIDKLKEIVEEQLNNNSKAKIIVFAQFRETVRKIAEELNKLENSRAEIFVGQAKKSHNSFGGETKFTGLKQSEQKQMIKDFSDGKINVLVATSIAEEGLDIPEVSEVIFYEPIPSAIRNIQRRGRTARLMPGALKILITKNTRDQSYYYASHHKEKRMHSAIQSIKEDMDKNEKQKELF